MNEVENYSSLTLASESVLTLHLVAVCASEVLCAKHIPVQYNFSYQNLIKLYMFVPTCQVQSDS